VRLCLALGFCQHDTRGFPHLTKMKSAPAHCGACLWCKLTGQAWATGTIYPCAVRGLARQHAQRKAYNRAFATEIHPSARLAVGGMLAPLPTTHAYCKQQQAAAVAAHANVNLTAAQRKLILKVMFLWHARLCVPITDVRAVRQGLAFVGVDHLSTELPYYNIPRDNFFCTPHGVKSLITDVSSLIIDSGGPRHTARRNRAEKASCPPRLPKIKAAVAKAHADRLKLVNYIVRVLLVMPAASGHGQMNEPFLKKKSRFTIHDAIVFCSSYGVYLIIQLQLPKATEKLYVDMLYAVESLTLKWYKVSPSPPIS
jgi:hypothetical protein